MFQGSRDSIIKAKYMLDHGVMTTRKRQILSSVFTVLCFEKSLLIRNYMYQKVAQKNCIRVICMGDQENVASPLLRKLGQPFSIEIFCQTYRFVSIDLAEIGAAE